MMIHDITMTLLSHYYPQVYLILVLVTTQVTITVIYHYLIYATLLSAFVFLFVLMCLSIQVRTNGSVETHSRRLYSDVLFVGMIAISWKRREANGDGFNVKKTEPQQQP